MLVVLREQAEGYSCHGIVAPTLIQCSEQGPGQLERKRKGRRGERKGERKEGRKGGRERKQHFHDDAEN